VTDYTSIELYCYNEKVLAKFLYVVVGRFPDDAKTLLAHIGPALQDLFLFRVATKKLDLKLTEVPFEKSCSIASSRFAFDFENYVNRSLNKNAKMKEKPLLLSEVRSLRRRLSDEPRLQIHGHDFTKLLSWYIKQRTGRRYQYDQEFFSRSLCGCLEPGQLVEMRLFVELLKRFA